MSRNLVGNHAKGKVYVDKILNMSAAAVQAVGKYGKENVINGTSGVMCDEEGALICLPTVEKVFRNTATPELIGYAPISGSQGFQDAAIAHTFGDYQPDGYVKAIATPGGAGAVSCVIWNYSDNNDMVLTHDWFWTPYKSMCTEIGRKLETFSLFNEKNEFNLPSFETKVSKILKEQDRLVIILNTPGNNPTGYTLANEEWDGVIETLKTAVKSSNKNITLLIDIAYIDFVKNPAEVRSFMKKLSNLPENIFVAIAFSMSKSFTLYGQRTGAIIGVSSSKDVIEEFTHVTQVTGRTRWSNVNRGSMHVMATIYNDTTLLQSIKQERTNSMAIIAERADFFMGEAAAVGLDVLPYRGGFFITVPTDDPDSVSKQLGQKNIFLVPLSGGIRIAICAIPKRQIKGLATAIKEVLNKL